MTSSIQNFLKRARVTIIIYELNREVHVIEGLVTTCFSLLDCLIWSFDGAEVGNRRKSDVSYLSGCGLTEFVSSSLMELLGGTPNYAAGLSGTPNLKVYLVGPFNRQLTRPSHIFIWNSSNPLTQPSHIGRPCR